MSWAGTHTDNSCLALTACLLKGQNPGACMFHAQMRLSLDGCRKLAGFLTSSSRVRALSLSHNFLGDDGAWGLGRSERLACLFNLDVTL